MELKRAWIMVMMLMFLKGLWCTQGCWEQERIALMQLKHFFNAAFIGYESNSNCCQWENVVCNNSTGRVIELLLSETRDGRLEKWYMNASLFLPFEKLEVLQLDDNQIAGLVDLKGFETLSSLSNLEVLDLSSNEFNNSILPLLGGFVSLKSLNLQGNRLQGSMQIEGIAGESKLINLEFLDLSGNDFDNNILSFFGEIPSLKSLYVGYNQLKGPIQIKDALCNLEELDLRGNTFEKFMPSQDNQCVSKLEQLYLGSVSTNISTLLQSLWSFPFLKTLVLEHITFNGTASIPELHNLTNLEELILDFSSPLQINFIHSLDALPSLKNLSLSFNETNGTITIQDLPNFKNLERLDLYGIALNTNFLQAIGLMDSLMFLTLRNSGLNGTLPSQGLCKLKHLRELDFSFNNLEGDLPKCFGNLTSLQSLDLSRNHFTGDIAMSPLKSLTSINFLSLHHNNFKIPSSLSPFFNYSKLKSFVADGNEVYDDEGVSHSFTPKFQLTYIFWFGFGHGGEFPKFFYYQHDLIHVELSSIHLKGEFPHWLLENNTQLWMLRLSNVSLSGSFHLPASPRVNLQYMDISNNFFHGKIPRDVGAYFPRLQFLNMSMNAFNDSIPSSFGDINSLLSLDLSNNYLTGGVPKPLGMGCFVLVELILSNNSLEGPILPANFGLTNLMRLHLDGNNFSGKLPHSLVNCSHLEVLDISNNNLSGGIPGWMGNMSSLRVIVIANNHLEGSIPTEYCQLDIRVLDLSQNIISERIPYCFSPPHMYEVHLSNNLLEGTLGDAFSNSSSMEILDLSHNNLTGSIPKWIEKLSQLSYLLLNNNDLEGEIPSQLCQLDQLSLIDLSHNKFSGRIPNCLHITAQKEVIVDPYSYPKLFAGSNVSLSDKPIEFTTKSISYSYQRRILRYFFGIDLSSNKLIGEIPHEFGNFSNIRVLNLSHNFLFGPIPPTFENLKQIESLDLSNNKLSGKIPPQLVGLHFLSKFLVTHNNLSGKIPEAAQFATFDKSSYVGNPLLCGTPLPKSCDPSGTPSSMPNGNFENGEEDSGFIDMDIFYTSFMVTYIVVLSAIALVLYINSSWRKWWFYQIEMFIMTCYYFVVENIPRRFFILNI